MSEEPLTQEDAARISSEIWGTSGLMFDQIYCIDGVYSVRASYTGPRMIYQEPGGRRHRLSPGMLEITNMDEWEGIRATITNGTNAEFL